MRHAAAILGLVAAAFAAAAAGKAEPEDFAKLGRELTPMGAEVAANREGTIPPWNGGLAAPPPCFKGSGSRYCDPFPEDRPLYSITRDNMLQHSGKLSAGQLALFRLRAGYRIDVYPTRRTFANPQAIYVASQANARTAELSDEGDSLKSGRVGIPFPLPTEGAEVIWNHRLRYRDLDSLRWNNQFAVNDNGEYSHTKFREEYQSLYHREGAVSKRERGLLAYFMQITLAPERLIGSALLLHETLDSAARERAAWQSNPGRRKWRKSPNIGYDTPGTGADGLRTNDQIDTFSGGLERYTWKLLTKKEMIVPANSYKLHSDALRYADIVKPGHIAQEHARYELRRVWHVEATLAKAASHQYRKRVLYVDEDGWQIRLVDLYDARDRLWRLQEAHTVVAYDKPYELPICETVYDLQTGRYLVQTLNNEDAETVSKDYEESFFEPSKALRRVEK